MLHFRVSDSSAVGHVRRQVTELARKLGLSAVDVGNVALVATELCTNILKHAERGELIVQEAIQQQTRGLDLLALDKGPGMEKVSECLRDGYSTTGGPGTGLGAIMRTATVAEIFSLPAVGTVLFARVLARQALQTQQTRDRNELSQTPAAPRFTTGVVSVAKTGQDVCGDGWAVTHKSSGYRLMVGDGLGHGPEARDAVREAVRIFHQRIAASLPDVLAAMHGALRRTRGAVIAVAEINRTEQVVHYCGVGNISTTLLTNQSTDSLVSANGIVGHQLPTLRAFTYPWNPHMRLVMHSDGLVSRWSVGGYPGLLVRHPLTIAGVLYRDFNRNATDDVTVAVVRQETGESEK
jgi:anti-sigma regulatory factor (Ser/Thr protein kinase)